eukprot:Transcript_25863.p3 GENE.Transcript_25863~~Transcript_25863.p3  ORF type:complete len:80 (+),score=5.34 Transcript_25863:237-476(+)
MERGRSPFCEIAEITVSSSGLSSASASSHANRSTSYTSSPAASLCSLDAGAGDNVSRPKSAWALHPFPPPPPPPEAKGR